MENNNSTTDTHNNESQVLEESTSNYLNSITDLTIDGFVDNIKNNVKDIIDQKDELDNTTNNTLTDVIDGSNIQLGNTYTLWCHDVNNKFWDIDSYKQLMTFNDVSSFWKLINNLNKMGIKYNHFFLMKGNIEPTWEHEENRNGGVCSLKTEIHKASEMFEYLTTKMVSGELSMYPDDINGISISPKNNWAIIKIWNSDMKHDLSKTLTKDVINKYSYMDLRYKPNVPEF